MYDCIVIGGGPGGYTAALEVAKRGMRAAIVERREIGGTCLNAGCVPVKALLRAAKAYDSVRGGGMGVLADNPRIDMLAMRAYQEDTMTRLREGLRRTIKSGKVDVIAAEGKVVSGGMVAAGDKLLAAQHIVVATGGVPSVPPVPGADLAGVVTSDGLLKWGRPIGKLVVIGGGVVGCEFAYMYACLGAEVTVIEAGPRLLPAVGDKEVSQNLAMIFKKHGVSVLVNTGVKSISRADGGLRVAFGEDERAADAALIATGRKADAGRVFAEDAQAAMDAGGAVVIDERCRTSIPGVYAVGDMTSGSRQLAHAAYAQAKIAAADICGHAPDVDASVIPACVYTEPEIAVAGVSMDEAKERGLAVRKVLTGGNAKSVIDEQERGFVKLAIDEGRVVGASLMCGRASDLVGELALAIANKLTEADIKRAVHPHPSYCEAIWETAE